MSSFRLRSFRLHIHECALDALLSPFLSRPCEGNKVILFGSGGVLVRLFLQGWPSTFLEVTRYRLMI